LMALDQTGLQHLWRLSRQGSSWRDVDEDRASKATVRPDVLEKRGAEGGAGPSETGGPSSGFQGAIPSLGFRMSSGDSFGTSGGWHQGDKESASGCVVSLIAIGPPSSRQSPQMFCLLPHLPRHAIADNWVSSRLVHRRPPESFPPVTCPSNQVISLLHHLRTIVSVHPYLKTA